MYLFSLKFVESFLQLDHSKYFTCIIYLTWKRHFEGMIVVIPITQLRKPWLLAWYDTTYK